MERTLRATALNLHVSYANGGFSGNMSGRNYVFTEHDGTPCLRIDLSHNLRVKNKVSNEYEDARDFLTDHAQLKTVQLEESVVKKFARKLKSPKMAWKLEFDFADKGKFTYSVRTVRTNSGSVFIDVSFDAD